jgi:hypothetical protein
MTTQPTNFELRVFFDVVNRLAMFEAQHRANGKGMFNPKELPVVEVPKVMQWLDYLIQNPDALAPKQVFVPQFQVTPVVSVTGEQPAPRKKPGPKPRPKPGEAGYVAPNTYAGQSASAPAAVQTSVPQYQTPVEVTHLRDRLPPEELESAGHLLPPEDPTFVTQVKPGAPFDYTQEVAGQVLIIPEDQPKV